MLCFDISINYKHFGGITGSLLGETAKPLDWTVNQLAGYLNICT